MAIEQKKILFRRGNEADLVVGNLQPGEPILALDTNKVAIKGSSGELLLLPAIIAEDNGTGNSHYEKYANGKIHEWGSYTLDIAFTVKYGETMYFHSDTDDTNVTLPVPINLSKSYTANVSFNSTGVLWCANAVVQNTTSGTTTTSRLYYRATSGKSVTLSVGIHWNVWGFWN